MLRAFSVVLGVSLICSTLVTSAVVLLEQRQTHNRRSHKIGDLLALAVIPVGADEDPVEIYRDHVEPLLVDLEAGSVADLGELSTDDLIVYDIERRARHPEYAAAKPPGHAHGQSISLSFSW